MSRMLQKLKARWNIDNNTDFVLIMLVFSMAGMGVCFFRKGIFHIAGLDHASVGMKIFFSLILIMPLYQISTLIFAIPLGQFSFFWQRQLELYRFLTRIFKRLKNI